MSASAFAAMKDGTTEGGTSRDPPAAWALSSGFASAAEAAPTADQTVTEWQNAVTADIEACGDKNSLELCALKPPFAGASKICLSGAFSRDDKLVLALVAVSDGVEGVRIARFRRLAHSRTPRLQGQVSRDPFRRRQTFAAIPLERSQLHVGAALSPRADDVFFG
jgi:hypothetical protein